MKKSRKPTYKYPTRTAEEKEQIERAVRVLGPWFKAGCSKQKTVTNGTLFESKK
ncbi:MAG: hypothetical protein ABIG61_07350 [Planctomycetota bacterium]